MKKLTMQTIKSEGITIVNVDGVPHYFGEIKNALQFVYWCRFVKWSM